MHPDTVDAPHQLAAVPPLYIRDGRRYLPAPPDVMLNRLRQWAVESFRPGAAVLTSPELVEAFLLTRLAAREYEVFAVILDAGNRLIEYVELFRGNINGSTVHVGEVVKTALRYNAVSVIMAHNHPSGRGEPSNEDIHITRLLRRALALVDISVVDHLIVGKEITSFAKRRLLDA